MSEIEISDRLLSWIFGCECEFVDISNNYLEYATKSDKYIEIYNLYQFIHLAKIKCFECGIMVVEGGSYVTTYKSDEDGYRRNRIRSFNGNPYDIKTLINCLEYVAEKIGDNNVEL